MTGAKLNRDIDRYKGKQAYTDTAPWRLCAFGVDEIEKARGNDDIGAYRTRLTQYQKPLDMVQTPNQQSETEEIFRRAHLEVDVKQGEHLEMEPGRVVGIIGNDYFQTTKGHTSLRQRLGH